MMREKVRETGLIGLIQRVAASVGLEADQPDGDRVSSGHRVLVVRSGCDQSDQGRLP